MQGVCSLLASLAIKYLSRMGKKGSAAEDAAKAGWYVGKLRELLEVQ